MQTDVMNPIVAAHGRSLIAPHNEDPLDGDAADDAEVVTTRRGLVRLALVAAETASRFAREDAATDPMAWMLAPRRLFDGRAAIDACLGRDECARAVLLHGLSFGMDADPEDLDALASDEGDYDYPDTIGCMDRTDGGKGPRLWTSFLVERSEAGSVQAFDAVIADDRAEAEARLRARYGGAFADAFDIIEGFDASLPLSEALVSPALADMLKQVAQDPASPLAAGLSISVQQRFAA